MACYSAAMKNAFHLAFNVTDLAAAHAASGADPGLAPCGASAPCLPHAASSSALAVRAQKCFVFIATSPIQVKNENNGQLGPGMVCAAWFCAQEL